MSGKKIWKWGKANKTSTATEHPKRYIMLKVARYNQCALSVWLSCASWDHARPTFMPGMTRWAGEVRSNRRSSWNSQAEGRHAWSSYVWAEVQNAVLYLCWKLSHLVDGWLFFTDGISKPSKVLRGCRMYFSDMY